MADSDVMDSGEEQGVEMPSTAAFETPTHFNQENLAEFLSENELGVIAQDIEDWVQADKSSRQEWSERESRGIRMMGVSSKTIGGADFKGASRVVHPLLAEACVQFAARAMTEIWPAEGPVKTQVLGASTPERQQQAERVKGFCNYQYNTVMASAYDDHDAMMFRLPISGSCFKHVTFDSVLGMPVSRFVEPSRFHVPYSAASLIDASRYTYEFYESKNDTRKKIRDGIYVEVDLQEPEGKSVSQDQVEEEIDATEGRASSDPHTDNDYTRYECHCLLDLPGFEDDDGIHLPYIVTTDAEDCKVLSITRNWKEEDEDATKIVKFAHYKFLQGLGFYGFGYIHVIGGLSDAATGALRAYLDSTMTAVMGGGFVSSTARLAMGDKEIKLGEWNEIDASPEDMKGAIMPFPVRPPDRTVTDLLGYLSELGQRFASTTENVVGDANNAAPVGTTLALIEQGLKIFSGIHRRLFRAQTEEFRILVALNAAYLPEEYPYDVPDEERSVFQSDFDDRIDVIPVSDPNVVSSTQRIALAQSVLQLTSQAPDLYGEAGRRQAHRMMLTALRTPNIDELLPIEVGEIPAMDPVTENVNMINKQPVQAFPQQNHEAHNIAHAAIEGFMKDDEQKAALTAHMNQHVALQYRVQVEQQLGYQITGEEYPPEIEARIAEDVAMRTQVSPMGGAPQAPEQDSKMAETQAKIERDDLVAAAGIEREQRGADAAIERGLAEDMAKAGREAVAAMGGTELLPGA